MSETTFKSAFRKSRDGSKSLCEHLNLNDLLCECDSQSIEREKLKGNGNGEVHLQGVIICCCAEGIVNGKRVAVHRLEDCLYCASRSALVETAAQRADKAEAKGKNWMRVFVREMDQLAKPLLNGAIKHHVDTIGTATPTEATRSWWPC